MWIFAGKADLLFEFCPCRIILSLVNFSERLVAIIHIIRSLFLLRGNYSSLFFQIQSPRILLYLTVMKQEVLPIPQTRLQEAAVLGLLWLGVQARGPEEMVRTGMQYLPGDWLLCLCLYFRRRELFLPVFSWTVACLNWLSWICYHDLQVNKYYLETLHLVPFIFSFWLSMLPQTACWQHFTLNWYSDSQSIILFFFLFP